MEGESHVAARVLLHIGKINESNEQVMIEGDRSRAVFICGKRGSGKSYTMGVLVEELFDRGQEEILIVLADPMGIFHTMTLPNEEQAKELYEWGLTEKGLPVRLLVPGDPVQRYGGEEIINALKDRGVDVRPLRVNPANLSPDSWCSLFNLNVNDLMGIALYRAVSELQEKETFFSVRDLEKAIDKDVRAQEKTKEALFNRLNIASKWGIFLEKPLDDSENLFTTKAVNVLDLSVIDPGTNGLRALIIDIIARHLFTERTKARRREEFGLTTNLPRVWLVMDEAHQFVPQGKSSLCKEVLIRWVKEGRQPGLGLIAATQQPSAIDTELLSQCDLILAHKITAIEDIQALNKLSATYMSGELKTLVRNLHRRGEAIVVDDEKESVTNVLIRPRRSKHGGGETIERKLRQSLF